MFIGMYAKKHALWDTGGEAAPLRYLCFLLFKNEFLKVLI
jgi:hypothetical protein